MLLKKFYKLLLILTHKLGGVNMINSIKVGELLAFMSEQKVRVIVNAG
jgi:hypothetical protein